MPQRRTSHTVAAAVVTLLVTAVLGIWFLGTQVFCVREVIVEGNRFRSAQEVVIASGIQGGENVFLLDETKVRESLEKDRYLRFMGMTVNLPQTVILRVTENSPQAVLTWLGVLVVIDDQGMVLERSGQLDIGLDLPVVTGVEVSDLTLGQPLSAKNPAQLVAMRSILSALNDLDLVQSVSELNVSNLDNLYLVTREGMKVSLGNTEQIIQKVGILKAVMNELTPEEMRQGSLDVTSGKVGDFSPKPVYDTGPKVDATRQPAVTATPKP